jgi:redox-sensitive bicupin YhaK (pirin superfamily)
MTGRVLQTVALGSQWPTIDPFLFCVHHDDAFPAGDGTLAPDVRELEGRDMGADFTPKDGWRMYHGSRVPGFPAHPHRGFETVTFVRKGLVDHSDSMGAAARYGRGDVQWLTAGGGIMHAEMFPLVDADGPNPMELFQIWLNLPAADKMADPHFTMLWDEDIPRHVETDAQGRETVVTVVAGSAFDVTPPSAPPASYASKPESDVAIWHLQLDGGASLTLPSAKPGTVRVLYVFEGGLVVDGQEGLKDTGLVVDADSPLPVTGLSDGAGVLVLQGRPIGEPVVQHGPFVMNTETEIRQAFADFQRTRFGGWPWTSDDPDHGPAEGRFARHADGTVERVGVTTS